MRGSASAHKYSLGPADLSSRKYSVSPIKHLLALTMLPQVLVHAALLPVRLLCVRHPVGHRLLLQGVGFGLLQGCGMCASVYFTPFASVHLHSLHNPHLH